MCFIRTGVEVWCFNLKLHRNAFSSPALSGHGGKNYSAPRPCSWNKKSDKEGGEGTERDEWN